MTFKKGKQKFTRQEIIDILKRNVSLFKDEEEFVQYIVDLAMYLVEHRLRTTESAQALQERPEVPAANAAVERRQEQFLRTRQRDEELYNVLKKHSTRSESKKEIPCKMCGAPTGDRVTCPNCGNMAF